jgi:prepilin-type N-terminal cleavage/methylation domain-containing protein
VKAGDQSRRGGGFTLLEMMLALAVFSFAMISLLGSLRGGVDAAIELRQERQLQELLADRLEELRAVTLEVETKEIPCEVFPGKIVWVIEPIELKNEAEELLDNLFRIEVSYVPSGPRAPPPLSIETYVHQAQ